MLDNKKILIIGASGTLGQALIDELLKHKVHSIRCFSRNEHKQFLLRQKYGEPTGKMRYLVGDIREKERLNKAFIGVDIVINCAALKHVSICEENPFEALQTNVVGVQNALECAVQNNIETFVQISTDKACNPINMYGCTKALAEGLVLNVPQWQGENRSRFIVIRSGNIQNSSGSVLQIWDKQFSEGKPLTVTSLEAERYMATKGNIVKTILKILEKPESGLYVLNMPKYSVCDLLKKYPNAKHDIIGLRPWEKIAEELYREGEKFTLVEVNGNAT